MLLCASCAADPAGDDETEAIAQAVTQPGPGLWLGAGPHPCSAKAPVVVVAPTAYVGEPSTMKSYVHDVFETKLPVPARVCLTVTPTSSTMTGGDVYGIQVDGKTVWTYLGCHPTVFGATPGAGCEFVEDKKQLVIAIQLPAGTHSIDVTMRDKAAFFKQVSIVAQGLALTEVKPLRATAGQLVSIYGEGFAGALKAAIGSNQFEIVSVSPGEDLVKVRVPKQPVVGSLALSNALGSVISPEPFDGPNWACKPPFEIGTYQAPASDTIAFDSLIEGAGYGASTNSGWVDAAGGNLCGGGDKELLLVKNRSSMFSVLGGPTPHAIGAGNIGSTDNPWRAVAVGNLIKSKPGVADYDEFVALRHVTENAVDVVVGEADPTSCVPRVRVQMTLGNPGNSEWVDVAVGDFDNDGTAEIAMIKNEHTNLFVYKIVNGAFVQVFSSDLDSNTSRPWKAIAAGNIDGVPGDELVLARHVSDSKNATVLAYKLTPNGLSSVGLSFFGNNGNSRWASATVGDFNGDGRASIVVAKNEHSNFAILEMLPQTLGLTVTATHDLDTAEGHPWKGLTAVDWSPRGDRGAHELIAVREPQAPYFVDVFVYGNAWHRRPRDTGLLDMKGQEFGVRTDIEQLRKNLVDSGTNTYQWFIQGPGDYQRLTEFLAAYKTTPANYCVAGKQMRIWVGLSLYAGACSPPEDSSVTDWNELSFFAAGAAPASCLDVQGWAKVVNRLAQDYPQVVGFGMDDASHSLYTSSTQPCVLPPTTEAEGKCHVWIDEQDIANLSASIRRDAFWVNYVPSFYARSGGGLVQDKYRDLGRAIDSILFFFRNEVEGVCKASCTIDIPDCDGQCLASACAEDTEVELPCEMRGIQKMVPAGRPIQLGIYATGHSCGVYAEPSNPAASTPSNHYVYDLARLATTNPSFGFGGAMIYEAQAPVQDCAPDGTCSYCDSLGITDKYCAVRHAFRDPPSSPFDPAAVTCN